MKNVYKYIVSTLVVVVISCNTNIDSPPKDLIKEEMMVDVIVEIELTQALVKLKLSNQDTINKQAFFNQVYEDFSISEKQFNSSLSYYCKKPKNLMDLYAKVITKLSEKQVAGQ